MAKSPTELTLAFLRTDGWLAEVVERWIPGANIRKDLWGFGDVIAIRGTETLLVQTTSWSNVSARLNKITDDLHADYLAACRKAGWLIHIHGWKHKKVSNRLHYSQKIVDLS